MPSDWLQKVLDDADAAAADYARFQRRFAKYQEAQDRRELRSFGRDVTDKLGPWMTPDQRMRFDDWYDKEMKDIASCE